MIVRLKDAVELRKAREVTAKAHFKRWVYRYEVKHAISMTSLIFWADELRPYASGYKLLRG